MKNLFYISVIMSVLMISVVVACETGSTECDYMDGFNANYCDGDNWMISFFDYECIAEECQDVGVPELIATCSYPQICDAGSNGCFSPACWIDDDCGLNGIGDTNCNNDLNRIGQMHENLCSSGGTVEASCFPDNTYEVLVETCEEGCGGIDGVYDDAVCIDFYRPTLDITYPVSDSNTSNASEINYIAFHDNPCDYPNQEFCHAGIITDYDCWYSLDYGLTNSSSQEPSLNFTDIVFDEGWNNVTIYCDMVVDSDSIEKGILTYSISDTITFFLESPEIPEEPTPEDNLSGNPVYEIMNSAGAGLGIFIVFMGQALPVLLIIFGFVGIVVAIGYGISKVIKSSVKSKGRT